MRSLTPAQNAWQCHFQNDLSHDGFIFGLVSNKQEAIPFKNTEQLDNSKQSSVGIWKT